MIQGASLNEMEKIASLAATGVPRPGHVRGGERPRALYSKWSKSAKSDYAYDYDYAYSKSHKSKSSWDYDYSKSAKSSWDYAYSKSKSHKSKSWYGDYYY